MNSPIPNRHTHSKSTVPQSVCRKYKPASKGKSRSAPRVDIKLYQNIKQTRLEKIRRNIEDKELEQMQAKPKIGEKSKLLAKIAEKKFFEECRELPETNQNEVRPQEKKTRHKQSKLAKDAVEVDIFRSFCLKRPETKKFVPKKSLYQMTVLERNQHWLEQKEKKISVLKDQINEQTKKDCPFRPNIYNNESSKAKDQSASAKGFKREYNSISPYRVRVSFQAGCDIGNYIIK